MDEPLFDLGVLQGDKELLVKPVITDKDLQKIALYIFVAMFVAVLLANLVTIKF